MAGFWKRFMQAHHKIIERRNSHENTFYRFDSINNSILGRVWDEYPADAG